MLELVAHDLVLDRIEDQEAERACHVAPLGAPLPPLLLEVLLVQLLGFARVVLCQERENDPPLVLGLGMGGGACDAWATRVRVPARCSRSVRVGCAAFMAESRRNVGQRHLTLSQSM